jgi:hypothetical protein
MFAMLPFLWMAFMLTVLVLPIVEGIRSRPKAQPKTAAENLPLGEDGLPEEAQILDFGDEMAEMEPK